jgi:ABC-type uncharacterized transport system substrate-binding protein
MITNKTFRLPALFIFTAALIFNCAPSLEQRDEQARILIVHSYHAGYDWTGHLHRGVIDTLAGKGLQIKVLYMDTKRHTDEDFKKAAGEKALDMIGQFKPHVVIASDDNAQAYAGKFLVNSEDVSIVFCGVNEDPALYGYPGGNVTGIVEKPHIRNTLNLLQKVCPTARTFTVLADTGPTSSGIINYLKQLNLRIQLEKVVQTNDYNRWKQEWRSIGSDAVIVTAFHTLRDRGKPVDPGTALKWMSEHMHKPVVSFIDGDIRGGFLLGHVHSPYEHGELAAKKALEILDGKKAIEIPVTSARSGIIAVNGDTARKLGIDLSPIKNIADLVYGAEAGNEKP